MNPRETIIKCVNFYYLQVMKNILLIALLSISVLTGVQVAANSSPKAGNYDRQEVPNPPCSVNDPTGTPLNVRSEPNGEIIARLTNDTIVEQTDTPLRGKWKEIAFYTGSRRITGWVFKDYLACG